MGKKMTRAGMELRRAIRAELDASPGIDHLAIRKKFQVGEAIIESSLTKPLAEWDELLARTPPESPGTPAAPERSDADLTGGKHEPDAAFTMPGLEQGFIKFTRKPAKMGMDFIFWVPRVYVKNGLVDPRCEYEVFLKKTSKK